MTVALDSFATPASGTGQISYSHVPTGVIRGFICTTSQAVGATDEVTSVTYGGVALTRVAAVFHTTSETGAVYVYFLGTNIPGGTQQVVMNVNGTGSTKRITTWALTAAKDCVVQAFDNTINSDSLANPSVTLPLSGKTCWCAIVFLSGSDATSSNTPLASWTATLNQQYTLQTGGHYRYNTIASADVTAGWTQVADDASMIAVAVTETSVVLTGPLNRTTDVTSITGVS